MGAGIIGAFYGLDKDTFTNIEDIWEEMFGIIASIIISIMGSGLLRVNKMKEKWRVKLARALETRAEAGSSLIARLKQWSKKYDVHPAFHHGFA